WVKARDLESHEARWAFRDDPTADTAPVVDNGVVYVGSRGGWMYGLEATTGRLLWSANLANGVDGPDEATDPLSLMNPAVGEGLLVVTAGVLGGGPGDLVAFRSAAATATFDPTRVGFGRTPV